MKNTDKTNMLKQILRSLDDEQLSRIEQFADRLLEEQEGIAVV